MSPGFRLRLFVVSALLVFVSFVVAGELAGGHALVGAGAVAAIAVAFVLVIISHRWLAHDLRVITEAARRMAAGDLEIRTRLRGKDDVEALGAALDGVAESLSLAMNDLRGERDLVAGILDGMREGVLLIDREGHVALVNPALRDIMLLSADVTGRPMVAVIRHATLMELLDKVRLKREPASAEIDVAGLKPRRVLVRVARLANSDGALLAVFVDVTDLRRLESVRRDFVANVSHELRTPVTAVQSAAETLRSGALRDEVAANRFLEIIERNTERLRSLIDDLLDLSRIESREFKIRRETLDVAVVVTQTFVSARTRAEAARVELVSEVAANTTLATDRRALEQVLGNLIENAVKYCPGARVTVSARSRDRGAIVLTVADTGPGIEARHLARLFERFYRVDPGRSREIGGTGLGLSIVKHLVEALGGSVTVESAVGKGTSFIVTLPGAADSSSPRLPEGESPPQAASPADS